MATAYPGGIDAFNNPTAGDNLDSASVLHTAQHTNVNDAVEAIETELGLNPKGAALSVRARLDALDTALAARSLVADEGAVNGIATLDGSGKLVQNLDATKINSGTLSSNRLPPVSGALIVGTGSGGAAIPVDAVPNLPASKTTSGAFDAARIPNLDASKTTTGVFDKARIPTDFGATAVVRADIAGRDSIPLANRFDGMMVYVRSPWSVWIWRADNSTWQCMALRVALSADQSTPAAAAFGNINGFSFAAMAGCTYGIDVVAFLKSSSSAPDMKFGWTWTGSGTMHSGFNGQEPGVTSAITGSFTAQAVLADISSPLDHATGVGVIIGAPSMAKIAATFVCTGSGTVQMRFAQNTSDATLPAIAAGSRMRVESY